VATEELKLVIDDAELTAALAKIMTITNAQKQTTGQLRGLSTLIRDTRRDARAAGINLDDLPTLNRDMRLIMGNIPMFRQLSVLLFQGRRGVRAQQLQREAEALKAAGLAPELAGELETAAIIGQLALVMFVVITLLRTIKTLDRIQKQMIRDMASFENEVRVGLDLTHAEFDELGREIIGFATPWEQLQAELKAAKVEGYLEGRWLSWDAIADYVKTRVGVLAPTAGWQPAANVPPQEMPYAPWLQGLMDWYAQVTDEIKEKLGADSGVIYDSNLEEGLTE